MIRINCRFILEIIDKYLQGNEEKFLVDYNLSEAFRIFDSNKAMM